jgi:hypothetical protein
MLLHHMVDLGQKSYAGAFAQQRSRIRAMELSLGMLCALGRRTLSRSICAVGRQGQDWSADYKIFSRSPWEPDRLFSPVLKAYQERYAQGPICLAFDDTKLPKCGRRINSAFWQRDPLSPPFHVNLLYGLRFVQVSLIFPHYKEGDFAARGIPVRFVECPALKKPGKRASAQQIQAYREALKTHNLSRQGLEVIKGLRAELDSLGQQKRQMLLALDGSLCNRTIFGTPLDRVDLVARCRKDARLCFPAPPGGRRIYGTEKFSPEAVRHNPAIPWQMAMIHFGGAWRSIRYKVMDTVLWQRGAATRPLRLLVVAPQPYKISPNSHINYRQPAYLLSTDLHSQPSLLLQCYFDRWQIEVNHREEKDLLGVGQAQVWSAKSIPRQPAFVVASYSMLLLAGLTQFGPGRTDEFVPLPKWRKKAKRPSALDLVTVLRKEINETPVSHRLKLKIAQNIVPYAYT